MSIKELKALIGRAGLTCVGCIEKSDLRARARDALARLDEAKRLQAQRTSPPPPQTEKTPQPSPAKKSPPPSRSPPAPSTYVYRAGAPPPRPPPAANNGYGGLKWSAADMFDSDGNEKFDVTTSDEDSDAGPPAPARAPPPAAAAKPKRGRRRTYDSDEPPSDCVSDEEPEYKPRPTRRPRAAKKRR